MPHALIRRSSSTCRRAVPAFRGSAGLPVTLASHDLGTAAGRTTNVGGVITLLAGFLATALVAGLLGAGLLMPAVGAAGASARAGVHAFDSLPAELKVTPLAQQSRILAADGSTIATFYDENRIVVPLTKIAPVMQTAIVAIEDDRFYQHGGIDPHGILRALVNNSQGDGHAGRLHADPAVRQADAGGELPGRQRLKCAEAATDRQRDQRLCAQAAGAEVRRLHRADDDQAADPPGLPQHRLLRVRHVRRGVGGASTTSGSTPASSTCSRRPCSPAWSRRRAHYDPYTNMTAAWPGATPSWTGCCTLKDITQTQHDAAVASKIVLHKGVTGNDCSSSKYPYFCDYVRRHPQHQRRASGRPRCSGVA